LKTIDFNRISIDISIDFNRGEKHRQCVLDGLKTIDFSRMSVEISIAANFMAKISIEISIGARLNSQLKCPRLKSISFKGFQSGLFFSDGRCDGSGLLQRLRKGVMGAALAVH